MTDEKRAGPAATEEEQAEVAQQRIKQLEDRLQALPKGRPFERGVLRFNLGVAYAESPTGDRRSNLQKALNSLESAVRLIDSSMKPIEHARAQNVLGITLRELGRHDDATAAFRKAAELVPMAVNPGEYGAPMNNLGLTLLDMGERQEAIEAFEKALEAFSGRAFLRQRVDALHNLGQAYASSEDPVHTQEGIRRYQEALEVTDPQEFPYQWALLQNSLGVAYTAIGEPEKAAEAFSQALRVYTRSRWPFQHALAKNNLGLANIQIGGVTALRRAVAACEEALLVLDVRLHREQWEQVYRNLELAEKSLKELGEEGSRLQHFARLLSEESSESVFARLRERLAEYTSQPDPGRTQGLAQLDLAILSLDDEGAQKVSNAWLSVLMELPQEEFLAGLHGRMMAHDSLDEAGRERATRILDYTIQNELLAPQRIRVRDTLYAIGYRRPGSEDAGEEPGEDPSSLHSAGSPEAGAGRVDT